MTYDENIPRKFARIRAKFPKFYGIFRWQSFLAGIALAVSLIFAAASDGAEKTYSLTVNPSPARIQRVTVVLDVKGQLRLNEKGSEVNQKPLAVAGRLEYEERRLANRPGDSVRRSCRYYETAEAIFQVANGRIASKLSEPKRLVVAQLSQNQSSISSPARLLTRDEFDLLNVQASSLFLDKCLPIGPVKIGGTWNIPDQDLALLMGIDLVTANELILSLDRVENGIAWVQLSGRIAGAASGVDTAIDLTGKLAFEISTKQVSEFVATIHERRAIGHAQPGFEVTAKLRVEIQSLPKPRFLSDSLLSQIAIDKLPFQTPLLFISEASHFRLPHDARWHCMVDRHDVSIFRLIDGGELVAQCNISELPDFDAAKRITLDEFQRDIQKSLGENFGEFVEATQAEQLDGRRTLRAVVSGTASGVSVRWLYYHISQRDGRQIAVAFTLEQDLIGQFAAADESLVESLELLPRMSSAKKPATATSLPPLRK